MNTPPRRRKDRWSTWLVFAVRPGGEILGKVLNSPTHLNIDSDDDGKRFVELLRREVVTFRWLSSWVLASLTAFPGWRSGGRDRWLLEWFARRRIQQVLPVATEAIETSGSVPFCSRRSGMRSAPRACSRSHSQRSRDPLWTLDKRSRNPVAFPRAQQTGEQQKDIAVVLPKRLTQRPTCRLTCRRSNTSLWKGTYTLDQTNIIRDKIRSRPQQVRCSLFVSKARVQRTRSVAIMVKDFLHS